MTFTNEQIERASRIADPDLWSRHDTGRRFAEQSHDKFRAEAIAGWDRLRDEALKTMRAALSTLGATVASAGWRPIESEVERRQIWREVQVMAGNGLATAGDGSPAWNVFADIHAFAVGQQLGERTEPMNQAPPAVEGEG